MKKIFAVVLLLATCACSSIDNAKFGGKDVVTSTRVAPVIFGGFGAPASKCLADLDNEGVKHVDHVSGPNGGDEAFLSRLSSLEICQAVGTK